jgi:hypothetical protein
VNFPSDKTKQTFSTIGESVAFAFLFYVAFTLVSESLLTGVIRGKRGFSCSFVENALCYSFSVAGMAAMGAFFTLGAWVAIHDLFKIQLASKLDRSEIVSFFRQRRLKGINWLLLPTAILLLAIAKAYEFAASF